MSLTVETSPIGQKLQRLMIYSGRQCIGEYERSRSQHVERKRSEVKAASTLLLGIAKTKGKFTVRWSSKLREKIVYVGGEEVARIPKDLWRPLPLR